MIKTSMESAQDRKKRRRVPFWRIADELGVCEETIKRHMRHQLDPEYEVKVLAAIDRAAEKMESADTVERE